MNPALKAVAPDKDYRPRAGSSAWRVIKFLQDNPDEELSREDIAVKFNAFSGSVDGALDAAVACDILRKRRANGGGDVLWLLGAKGIDLGDAPAVASVGAEMLPPIRKNAPLLDEKARRRIQYLDWLASFEVNDSAEFALSQRAEMRRMAADYEQSSGRKFVIVKTGFARSGIQRTA